MAFLGDYWWLFLTLAVACAAVVLIGQIQRMNGILDGKMDSFRTRSLAVFAFASLASVIGFLLFVVGVIYNLIH